MDDNSYHATTGGKWPLKWYAPEAVNYGSFSTASDVWSFGVTLWEMYSFGGEQPYGSMTGMEVRSSFECVSGNNTRHMHRTSISTLFSTQVLAFVEAGSRLPAPVACPDWCYCIMLRCWAYEPERRPRFGELARMFADRVRSEGPGGVVIV